MGIWLERTAHYFAPSEGSWDFFRLCENSTAYAPYLPISQQTQELLSKVRAGADLFGSALSIPKFFKNICDFKTSVLKADYQQTLFEFVNAINTASQAALCLHNAQIANLKGRVSFVNGINQVTTVLTDGYTAIEAYKGKDAAFKKWCTIAKSVASVAIATILLLGIFHAELLEKCAFPVVGLSSVYVLSSILAGLMEGSNATN